MRLSRVLSITVAIFTLASAGKVLGTPSTISYQGRLSTSGGTPVSDGSYAVTFSIWTDSVGGDMIWSELQDVQVTGGEGLFSCYLGQVQPLGGALQIHADDDLHLQTSVTGEVLLPRLAMGAVPHAFSSSGVHHAVPGVGSLEILVGDDTTKITSSHQGFSTLIDSYVHLMDDRGLLGLRAYDAGQLHPRSTSSGEVTIDEALSMTGVDVDEDGIPDVGSSSSAKLPRSVLKTFFERGDKPTQSRVVDSVDETGAYQATVRYNGTDFEGHHISLMPDSAVASTEVSNPDESSSSRMRIRINDLESKLQTFGLLGASSVTQSLTPTTCGVAINTKGTGADKNRTIGSTCDDSSAVHYLDVDDDGDGIAEGRGIISVKSQTGSGSMSASSRMTCDSDDDGVPETMAEAATSDKFAQVRGFKVEISGARSTFGSSCDSAGATSSIDRDSDDDGVPESEVSQSVTPTTSSVAIKWKGTGADANRTITSTCDDSSAVHALDLDEDGDGLPEQEIEQILTPTTSSVTIKTKSTGADANRVVSQTSSDAAAMQVATAGKNIGIYVSEVSGQASITMTDNTLGTVDTAIIIDGAAKRFGIGVAQPTNPIEHSSGAKLTAVGIWTNASDANLKENFQPVDGEELLEKLAALEVTRWNYKGDTESEHIGPTAQDFKETFGVGSDGKSISTIDPSGIALAAIKELNKQNHELQTQNRELQRQNASLQKRMDELSSRVEELAASR